MAKVITNPKETIKQIGDVLVLTKNVPNIVITIFQYVKITGMEER